MELSAPYSLSRRVPSATRPPLRVRASVVVGIGARVGAGSGPAGSGGASAAQDVELFERLAGSRGDAGQRGVGDLDRHSGLAVDALAEAAQERPTARKHDPVAGDIGRELGRGLLERVVD